MFMFNLDNLLHCPLSLIVKQGLGKTQPLEQLVEGTIILMNLTKNILIGFSLD